MVYAVIIMHFVVIIATGRRFSVESSLSRFRVLECDTDDAPICINGGVCLDSSKLNSLWMNFDYGMACVCPKSYYGPHCEFSIHTTILEDVEVLDEVFEDAEFSLSISKFETEKSSRLATRKSRKKKPRNFRN